MAEKEGTLNVDTTSSEQLDFFSTPLTVPVSKLDADEYSAEDLDGVTESLFGSGNLNFLSLQAGQTNDSLTLNDPFDLISDENSFSNLSFNNGNPPTFDSAFSNENTFDGMRGQAILTDTDRSVGEDNSPDVEAIATDGNFTNTTIGSIGASTLSSDVGSFAPSSNLDLGGDTNINENNAGDTNVVNNTTNDTVQNVVNTVNETIENILNLGDEIIENILEGDITEILNTTVNDITIIINDFLEATTNLVEILNLGDTILNITDITNNIFDLLGDGGIALSLDGSLLDSLGIDAELILDDTISGLIDTGLVTDNLNNLVSELTGLNLPVIGDLGAVISFDLLNYGDAIDNSMGDTDLSITGLGLLGTPNLDITLDPVETLLGDIDIGVNIPAALSDPQSLLEGVHDTIGGLGNLDPADVDEALDILGDEGLTGGLGLELFDTTLNESFDLTGDELLGGLDDVLGDLDLENPQDTLENITDILGDGADAGDLLGGVLGDGADTGDLLGGILGNGNDDGTDSDITTDINLGLIDNEIINDVLDIGLDTVEDLAGDIDLDIGAELDLLGNNEINNDAGDTDIELNLGIDLVDDTIIDLAEDIPLDPVEEIVGDIDLDIGLATDILGNMADPLVNEGEGGTGEESILTEINDLAEGIVDDTLGGDGGLIEQISEIVDPVLEDALDLLGGDNDLAGGLDDLWTEESGGGGLFDDIIGGDLGGGDALPDPVGDIAGGLGGLDIPLDNGGGGLLGGLFG